MIIVQVKSPSTAQCTVNDTTAIDNGLGIHIDTINHEFDKLRIDAKLIVAIGSGHHRRVEGNDMVERLHHNLARWQSNGLAIDKDLVGNMVILVIAIDEMHTVVFIEEHHRDTIAGSHPNIVIEIFDYGMNDIIV